MSRRHDYSGAATTASSGGVSLCTVLFLIFLVLKLVGVIDWSWWWVTAPLWIPFLIVLGISIITLIVIFTIAIVRYSIRKRKEKRYNGG